MVAQQKKNQKDHMEKAGENDDRPEALFRIAQQRIDRRQESIPGIGGESFGESRSLLCHG